MGAYNQYRIRVNGIEKEYPLHKYKGYTSRAFEFLTESKFDFNSIGDELHFQWCCRNEDGDWSCWYEDSVRVKRVVVLDFGYDEFTIDCEV